MSDKSPKQEHWINKKSPARPCTARDLTWGPKGGQCLNCGSEAVHPYDLRHSSQPVGG